MQHKEYQLQKAISKYLKYSYPRVFFLSDTVANLKLTKAQQGRNKEIQCQNFRCPDLLIFEPKNGYHGLFLELKTKSPFKKNGEILQNEHLIGQYETIQKLNEKGYRAEFVWSLDDAIKIIDEYLK